MDDKSVLDQLRTIQDYSTVERLASVLWKEDTSYHGVAVMVGAGFSRCSARTGDNTRKMPLWNEFSELIKSQMGSTGTDPLRIAEEYSAYFGRQALNDLIRNVINDSSWEPGHLHELLLKLPWTEVLSTNWDSLLERASKEFHDRFYSIVHRQEDLSSARTPRIVKLHGTINVTDNLVFTQEDYRTYPVLNAAFVNFTRQVFIENELCLIGFSGDDPNFLQWAGWVRDHLSTKARRIFLVGALNLSAAKRKYLESINIAPIDLEELVKDHDDHEIKHEKATELFLSALVALKPAPPWEWSRQPISDDLDIEAAIKQLEEERRSYPGWLVCPSHTRFGLQAELPFKWLHGDFVSNLGKSEKARLLYEVSWRFNLSFTPCEGRLAKQMLSVCDFTADNPLTKKQQIEIGLYLLKASRWFDSSSSTTLTPELISLLENNLVYWPEAKEHLTYYKIGQARDSFDYREFEKLLSELEPNSVDLKLRKAALYGELGEFEKGQELYSDIRNYLLSKYREERNSVFILSRLCFVDHILSNIEFRSSDFDATARESSCDFWFVLESLRRKVKEKVDMENGQTGIQTLFEPGRYKDNSKTTIFHNDVHPFFDFQEIVYSVGLPVQWEMINYLVGTARELSQLNDLSFRDKLRLSLVAAASETDVAFQNTISRVKLARVPVSECLALASELRLAIDYWYEKENFPAFKSSTFGISKIRVYLEALARFSIRLDSTDAKELFIYALRLGKHQVSHHHWLMEALNHLVEYSLASISDADKSTVIFDALSFPLHSEINIGREENFKWPNPVVSTKVERHEDKRVDHRILEIFDFIQPGGLSCADALERVIPLYTNGFLSAEEEQILKVKIWGNSSKVESLPDLGIYRWALLELPHPQQARLESLIIEHAFSQEKIKSLNPQNLSEIIGCGSKGLKPSHEKALSLFDVLSKWRSDDTQDRRRSNMHSQVSDLVGSALSESIVPALDSTDLNSQNFLKMSSFIEENSESSGLIGLVYFHDSNQKSRAAIIKTLRRFLQSAEHRDVAHAAFAINKLHSMSSLEDTTNLFSLMIEMISISRDSKARFVLQCLREAIDADTLEPEQLRKIAEIIPFAFDSSNYNIDSKTENDLPFLSLFRADLVKLAKELIKSDSFRDNADLTRVIKEASEDPLPEVRFS